MNKFIFLLSISVVSILLVACSASNGTQAPVNAPTSPNNTEQTKIFLTPERIAKVQDEQSANSEVWRYFMDRINGSLTGTLYNSNEYSAAFALAYQLTGNQLFLDRAQELFWAYYDGWNYTSKNAFRSHSRYAHFTFDWIRDGISQADRDRYISLFREWADYWEEHVDYANNFAGLRWVDTDHTTSLMENFLLLGKSFEGEDSSYARTMLDISDQMMSRYVVDTFMNDIFSGGFWGEGSDYSPNTMQHWMRAFFINKETRGIPYPTNYAQDVLYATLHMTFPGYQSMFQYGDIEAPEDYRTLSDDFRFEMFVLLRDLLENQTDKDLAQYWFNRAKEADGVPNRSGYSGMWRLLFEYTDAPEIDPESAGMATTYLAPGLKVVASRSSWNSDAAVLYFQNGTPSVDHMQKDALSYNIVNKGVVVTKEATGYAGPADASIGHNTLLIENIDGGSSSPGFRYAGDGALNVVSSTGFGTGENRDINYTYIEADATQLYNSSDYNADVYVDNVVRKLAYFMLDSDPSINLDHDGIVIVYDTINLKTESADRWKRFIQHFQVIPTLEAGDTLMNSGSYYKAISEGQVLYFDTLLPEGAVTSVVDESALWSGSRDYEVPVNQRKWHISVEPSAAEQQTEFLNVLQFGDSSSFQTPADLVSLTTNNANILSGNVLGVFIPSLGLPSEPYDLAVIFSRNADGAALVGDISYRIEALSGASIKHRIFGLEPNAGYSVLVSPDTPADPLSPITVTISSGGLDYTTNNEGVLVF